MSDESPETEATDQDVTDAPPAEESAPTETPREDPAATSDPSEAPSPRQEGDGGEAGGDPTEGEAPASPNAPPQDNAEGEPTPQAPEVSQSPPEEPAAIPPPDADTLADMAGLADRLQMETEGEVLDDGTHIRVIFTVRPEGFVLHAHFAPSVPCVYLYTKVSRTLRVDKRHIRLYCDGKAIGDTDILMDVVTVPTEDMPVFLDLELEQMPSVLGLLSAGDQVIHAMVTDVDFGEGNPSKNVNVIVTKAYHRKPFIGGHRHKKTGLIYHEAIAQTVRPPKDKVQSDRASRLVQTSGVTRSVQTHRECATQMTRSDLIVENSHDRVVTAKRYFSWDELAALQVLKAIVLQSYVRGWFARRHGRALRNERTTMKTMLEKAHDDAIVDHEKKKAIEVERRMHPRTARDFAVLYDELEAWRLQETQRIHDAEIPANEKQFALQELLKKETKLLQTIDKLQLQATKENRTRTVESTLAAMAGDKLWGTVNVETPYTIRAKELRDLYNGLQMRQISIDERLDILLHIKWTVKEFDCPLTREIVDLIDREADLLNRGRKSASIEGLRRRVSNLFLQFIETPEFNPEALNYTRVPLEYTTRPLVKLDVKR